MVNGSLNFTNVIGGGASGSSQNYGVYVGGVTVSAPVIIGRDLVGGAGTGANYGLFIDGTTAAAQLGSAATNVLTVSAASVGLGSNEYGIRMSGANGSTVMVGSGATLTLTGTGGGVYSGAGTLNHGIYLNGARIIGNGAGATTMALSGLGGQGSGGTNAGLYIDTTGLVVNFGTNANNQLNFLNCIGGFVGSNNYGVYVGGPVTTPVGNGLTQFLNATGGGNGTGTLNHGLYFNSTYTAPDIIAEATGGFGSGNDYGIFVAATLGGTTANQIRLTGSSLGTGSNDMALMSALRSKWATGERSA